MMNYTSAGVWFIMSISELVANIDLDGTVANFNKALLAALNEIRNPDVEPEYTSAHLDNEPDWLAARMSYIKRSPGFWRNLEPIPLGLRVVELIRDAGFRLNVLTKGPKRTTSAWTEKVEWVHEHLPDAQVTITQDKGLVYGKVLFDDWPAYITRWLEHRPRGLVLMLSHSWNQDFKHPNVIRVMGDETFPDVAEALRVRALQ
jgi:5'(3')-deoxyribonucleotidase